MNRSTTILWRMLRKLRIEWLPYFYISEIYLVKPDNEINPSPTIYVGL
jgi:hypothetical protein